MQTKLFKFISVGLLVVTFFSPLANLSGILTTPKAQAWSWPSFLPNPVANDEPSTGRDCGMMGAGAIGIPGECVPIKVDADPYRFDRNNTKSVLTWVLVLLVRRYAQWAAQEIDGHFRIQDYLSYGQFISDFVNKERFIFSNISNPVDRLLTSVNYDNVFKGGLDLNSISGALVQKSIPNLPNLNANDNNFYLNLARSGMPLADPLQWYHVYTDKALLTRAEAKGATASELSTSEGYKNSRDLTPQYQSNITMPRTLGYYTTQNGIVPILTPGGYAAKGIQSLMNKVLDNLTPSNNTNIMAVATAIADIIYNGVNDAIFKNGSGTLPDGSVGGGMATGGITAPADMGRHGVRGLPF